MKNFVKDCLVTKVSNGAVAGTTDVVSSVLDMAGYDAVAFIADLGTVTDGSVLELEPSENTASSTSSPTPTAITAAYAGPVTASTSSNTILMSEVIRPAQRYVFATLKRGTDNAVVNTIIAIQYRAKKVPVTQPASVLAATVADGGG